MAKQTFQVGIDFIANVNDLQSKIKTVTGDIAKMGSTSGGSQVQKQFDQLTRTIENLQTRAHQPITSQAEFNKLTNDVSKAELAYDSLINSVERLRSLSDSKKLEMLDPQQQKNIQNAANAIKNYETATAGATAKQKELEQAQKRVTDKKAEITGLTTAQNKAAEAVQRHNEKLKLLKDAQDKVVQAENALNSARSSGAGDAEIDKLTSQLQLAKTEAEQLGVKFTKNSSSVQSFATAVEGVKNKIDEVNNRSSNLKLTQSLATANAELNTLEQELLQLQGQNPTAQLQTAFEELKNKAQSLGVSLEGIDDISSIDQLKQRLLQLKQQGLDQVDAKIDAVAGSMNGDLRPALSNVRSGLQDATQGFQQFNRQAQEVEQLKSQLGYFFSLTNSVYLLRSALRSAFETVKELDAVMTETAVVTKYSVGDMWSRLPEYASAARELGSSIKDVYAATTLYYQQGLETNEAMGVGIETMKMARIAGLEAADATNAMTAALRGFNMEVNETNAQRVNDVYSNLAALSASNVEQISTAMSKTASIASAANMEFETTAALLAQIIETTQEAPETAGTALKTIIARFSEVKSLQQKGQTSGEDSEGESIDVNKIDKALKSVGISMDGFFSGTEGLDSVLMKLAGKWDTLDFATQRYIATMAAGSRQQSRFIAMMSDYERTTQLVSIATNSAGASQKQFDKTMESLEAKLNKLKVAWDQFTMNIANNTLIKAGIDLLTGLLNIINGITGKLPGIIGGFANLALVFVALRAGGALLNKALSGISGALAGGIINKATEAGVIGQATQMGVKAGAASAKGTAMGLQASQGALFKSYNLLFVKLQSTIPPIKIRMGADTWKAITAEMDALKIKMNQVSISAGRHSKEWEQLHLRYLQLKKDREGAVAGYILEGQGMDQLTFKQKQLLGAKIKEGEITTTQVALMGAETAARYAEVGAEGLEKHELDKLNFAKTTENNLRKGGITAFFTEIGLRIMGITATEGETVSLGALIKAKWQEFMARMAANSAMIVGIALVVALIAAVALLVVGIAKMINTMKKAKDGTLELEKINKTMEEVTEQTNKAQEAMTELAETKSGLEEMTNELDNLTKGTTEWKKKLTEVNMQVLDLINKYPELAGYVIRGENGELKISDEGWENAQNAAYERYNLMAQTSVGLQTQKTAAQQEIDFEAAQSEFMQSRISFEEMRKSEEGKQAFGLAAGGLGLAGGTIGGAKIGTAIGTALAPGIGTAIGAVLGGLLGLGAGYLFGSKVLTLGSFEEGLQREATGGLTEKEFTEFAAAAADKGLTHEDTAELQKLYQQMGYDSLASWDNVNSKIQKLGTSFDKLSNSSLEMELAQKTYVDSFMTQALGGAGLDSHDQANQISEIQAEAYENLDERIEAEVKNMEKGLTDDMKQQYASLTGKTMDEINKELKDDALSEETIKQTIATNTVQKQVQDSMKATAAELDRLKIAGKNVTSLFNMLSTQGRDIKLEDLEDFKKAQEGTDLEGKELSDITDLDQQKKAVENYLTSKGTSLTAMGLTGADDWQIIWKNLNIGAESFADASYSAERLGSTISNQVSAGAAKGLTEKIEEQLGQGSQNGGAILDWVARIIESNNLTAEQAEILYDTLGSIDWDNRGQLEELAAKLEQNGLDTSAFEDDILLFKQGVIDFANAVYDFTPEEQGQIIQRAIDLASEISKGGKTSYTEEEVKGFSTEVQKDFIKIGEKWYYKGALSSQQLIDDLYKTAGVQTSLAIGEKALGIIHDAQNSEGERKTKTSKIVPTEAKDTIDSNYVPIWDQGRVDSSALVTTAQKTGLGLTLFGSDDYINGKDNYQSWNTGATNREEFFKSDVWQQATAAGRYANDPYSATIYYLHQYAQWNDLPGLPKGATIEQVEKWYGEQNNSGKKYAAALGLGEAQQSHGVYTEQETAFVNEHREISKTTASGYTDVMGVIYEETTETGSDWDIIEKLASGELSPYKSNSAANEGEEVIEKDELISLMHKYLPDEDTSAMRPDEMATKLIEFASQKKSEADAITDAQYFQWFATMDISQVQAYAAEDTEIFTARKQAAIEYIDAVINSYDGAKAQAEALLNANQDIVGTYEDGETAIKAIVAANVQQEQKLKSFTQAIKDNVENLKKGEGAGEDYWKALQNIADAVENAFGLKVSQATILKWLPYLSDIAEGGEKAAAAYRKMAKEIMQVELLKELVFDPDDKTAQGQKDAYMQFVKYITENPIDPNDVIDLEQLYGNIGIAGEHWNWLTGVIESNPIYGTVTVSTELDGTTKKLFQLSDFASIIGSFSGGGGGGGSSSKWENPYDEFYNSVQKINEELRKREKLELRYQRLLDRNAATAKELASLRREQLASLQTERLDRTQLLGARKSQMQSILDQYSDVGKYASYDFETGQISIDWEALEALEGSTNEKLTSRIEDYIGKLEEQKDMIQEEEDALDDIEDAVWEIYDQGKDEYFGLEDRVKEALIDERQKEIDKLSDINDSINDTNSKLLDSMQQQIDAYRQTRDNEKTEQEIADKQRRLSYLSQDTSGANALEIKQLQKEIDEAQEDYTDTLIDQKISELQQQNDQAAEQRQQQIDLQQAMLNQYVDSGAIWEEVQSIISEGVDAEKKLMPGSRLESLLQSADGFEGMSHLKKMDWLNELENDLATSLAWLESGAMQALYGMGASVTFTNADGETVTGVINKDGDVLTDDAAYSAGSFKIDAATGQITSSESAEQAKANYEKASKVTSNQPVTNIYNTYNSGGGDYGGNWPCEKCGKYPCECKKDTTTTITRDLLNHLNANGKSNGYYAFSGDGVKPKFDANGTPYVPIIRNGSYTGYWATLDELRKRSSMEKIENGRKTKYTLKENMYAYKIGDAADKTWLPQYETGGLADFTGPAWLDGTKSRPEYILNADQTKAFFTLVDILSGLTDSTQKTSEKTGDNIYDIDINVESIGSDYDVEQIAGTIKRLIVEDAHYRNNNAINLMR